VLRAYGQVSLLWYKTGRLARIVDPGAETTDLGYDASGRITAIRDPLAFDAVAAGYAADDDSSRTVIAYTGAKVASVTGPRPRVGEAAPAHSYTYLAGATEVDVAGLAPPTGFATRVTYNGRLQETSRTDADGVVTRAEYNARDLLERAVDAAGRVSTTTYDALDRPVAAYDPAAASCFADNLVAAVLSDAPRGYWRLGETSGTTATDASGQGRHGTYAAVGLGVPGALPGDKGASFNGTDSRVTLPADVIWGSAAVSVEVWFRGAAGSSGTLFGYQTTVYPQVPTGGWVPALYVGTNGLLYGKFWPGGASITSPARVDDDAWHHAVVTTGLAAGSTQTLHLDGRVVGTANGGLDWSSMHQAMIGMGRTHSWPAGRTTDYHEFAGSIDEVAVYATTLPTARVAAHYQAGLAPAAGCAVAVPTTSTSYDEGLSGLHVDWFGNATLTGPPVAKTLGIPGGTAPLEIAWGSGAPAVSGYPRATGSLGVAPGRRELVSAFPLLGS